jgi:hypothetical protein
MKLIDRYVFAVTEHLPEDIREDVGKELRANIEDMLPENATEQEVYQVLEELGSPWKLANEYNPRKRYLIGPGYYDKYISTLKMVIGICILVFIGIAALTWVIEAPADQALTGNIAKLTEDLISAVFTGAFQGAFWVTLVFIILERSGVESGYVPFTNKKWTPDDLPEVPTNKNQKISRGETVFSMCCTILFTALIYFQPQLIALYMKAADGSVKATPLFEVEHLQSYMLIILLLAIIELAIFIWKYLAGSWNIPLAIGNAVNNVAVCVLLVVMLGDNALWNADFFSTFAKYTKISSQAVTTWSSKSIWIFAIVFIMICTWDSISAFAKCKGGFRMKRTTS